MAEFVHNDDVAQSRSIALSIDDLSRWETTGRRLETVAPSLLVEIHAIWIEPNPLRFSLAANAARYASWIAEEPLKTEAVALADELEQRAVD
jgi:hypothetical protein